MPPCRNVRRGANVLEVARFVSYRMRQDVDVFDHAVRHEKAMLEIEVAPALGCAIEVLLYARSVFRMNPLQYQLDCRLGRHVISGNSICFFGPENLSCRNIPAEAAGVA